ncbi:hypothetical protein C8R45DRAFT_27475 [Mycena sanguinolenta]|nr:hypothetical protein C8R45DRAFT_27475 [Mycena sanguinolenta]
MSRNVSQPPSETGSQLGSGMTSGSVQLSRPFRSRKNRPCDGCRRAKSRCAIPQAGPPCVECQQMNKQCTFDELPPERKKPKGPESPTTNMPSTSSHLPPESPSVMKRPRSPDSAALQALSYAAAQEKRLRIGEPEPISFDLSISRSMDAHALTTLLTDDLLPIGTKQAGPDDSPLSETPYIRQISTDRTKPQYIIFTKKRNGSSLKSGRKNNQLLLSCLSLLDPPPSEDFLLDIYLKVFNPAFPLLADERLLDSPLHTKLCLTALSHCQPYRSSIMFIRNIIRATEDNSSQEPSRLATVSAALLDLSARPVVDVEANYVLLARTIAQAQLLGLHINPTSWNIPSWEKDLRRILWWGLRIHDAWISFLNSRPSHIQVENHSTPLPDIRSASPSNSSDTACSLPSFVFLCRLSMLCSRLQSQVCTLASSILVPAERLATVKSIEEDTHLLLLEVRRNETARSTSSGVASLMTCLLGFRCMLRRISIELSIGLGSPFTPDPATLEMYAEAVDYISSLDAHSFDGFWLNYVGHILSSLTSSLIRLSLATSTLVSASLPSQRTSYTIQASSRTMPLIMLCRLQRALQAAKRDCCWDLAEPALNRAESVVNCLKSSSEYTHVVAALKGTYEPELPQPNGNLAPKANGVQDPGPSAMDPQYGWNIDLNAFGLDWSGADSGLTGIWVPPAANEGHVLQTNMLPSMYTD